MKQPVKHSTIHPAPTFVVLLLSLCAVPIARGQAAPTATKSLGLSVFGGATEVWPDYGHKGTGFVVGGDVLRHFKWADPSLEARYTYGSGDAVSEDVFSAGVKIEKALGPGGRFHPYGDLFVGNGNINYKHPVVYGGVPYAHDNSFIKEFGGGLDFDLTPHFAVKGDYQYSFWKLGKETNGLTPSYLSVGVIYRFEFRSRRGRN